MTDKKQAAKGQAPRKKEKASVAPSGSGQFLAEYRNLLDNCYTVPIRWGDAEGQEVLQGWAGKFIDRIRKWTRANLPDRSYGFILERVITDISAYEFADEPVFRDDGTLDEGKSKVRFDYTYKVPNNAPGAVLKEITVIGNSTAQALFGTLSEIGQQANARDAALRSIRHTVFAAIRELIGQLPAPIPKPFERTAIAQYDKMLKDELPGFSICPFPKQVRIGTRHTYPTMYGGTEGNEAWVRDPARWDAIGRALRNSGRNIPDNPLRDLLDGWSYATIVPDGLPNPKDIPNPRIYLLDGATIPNESMERNGKRLSQAANTIIVQFGAMVRRAWESPINLRDQAVTDLLDHHFKHGGNPVAFVKHVERITPNYKVDELKRLLSGWVVGKGDHNSTTTNKPKPAKEWPDLKCLALFHAYRYEAGDPSAEITKENCEQVAFAAGKTAKSSGKELLTYFHRYAYGRNRFNERTKEGKRRGDVLKRLNTVIKKLEDYPEARTIAEEERKAVRDRSNEGED